MVHKLLNKLCIIPVKQRVGIDKVMKIVIFHSVSIYPDAKKLERNVQLFWRIVLISICVQVTHRLTLLKFTKAMTCVSQKVCVE